MSQNQHSRTADKMPAVSTGYIALLRSDDSRIPLQLNSKQQSVAVEAVRILTIPTNQCLMPRYNCLNCVAVGPVSPVDLRDLPSTCFAISLRTY